MTRDKTYLHVNRNNNLNITKSDTTYDDSKNESTRKIHDIEKGKSRVQIGRQRVEIEESEWTQKGQRGWPSEWLGNVLARDRISEK